MLTYGIILSGARVTRWQMECVRLLRESRLAQLRCVINDSARVQMGSPHPEPLYSRIAGFTTMDAATLTAAEPVSWHEIDATCRPSPQLPEALDFLLLFGEPESGEALTACARYGVWYFVLSDLTKFTTAAPGFWEVQRGRDVTGAFMLQMHGGFAGVPLKSAFLPTRRDSFEANVESQLAVCAKWPLHVCRDIVNGAAGYFQNLPMRRPRTYYGIPSALDIAVLRLAQWRERAAASLRLHCSTIEWRIARVDDSPADFIGGDRSADVSYFYPREKSRYFADPCVVTRDAQAYLFCEEYRRDSNVGTVAVCELEAERQFKPRTAIEEPHHLSYPHVFEHDGVTYCVPESGGARKVCLYRCVEFPAKWEYVRTLIDGFDAADATLVHHDGRWWLFCTGNQATARENYSHLYVWHAEDLFGTWVPHVRNPVKIDARSSRPAGPFFMHGGALYRPAQDCSRSYGGAVRINRIDALSESDFSETVVGVIRPPRHGYRQGLHTIASTGDWCVVDVERYAFSAQNVVYAIRACLKSSLMRLGLFKQMPVIAKSSEAPAVDLPAAPAEAAINEIRVLAICGGGNAGHALAVAASQHFDGEIRWLVGSEEKAQLLQQGVFSGDGLQSTGVVAGRADRVRVISTDPADVISDADIILIAVPAFAHAGVLRRIAPHLKPGAAVGALPTRSGFEFEAAAILNGHGGDHILFGLQTLPWSTRVQQIGRTVNFGAVKGAVLMAALPRGQSVKIASTLSAIIGVPLMPTDNFLNLTLGNPGQIIHPGLMYGLFRDWDGRRYTESEVPYFYRDTRDDTGAFIEQLSADVRTVAAKIEAESGGALQLSGVLPIHEWIKLSYPSQTADQSTVASCFRTGPLQMRKAPVIEVEPGEFVPNFEHRYLTEDVPYGLVVTRAIAEICGVGTPAIDAVLRWAGRRLGTRYIFSGKIERTNTAALPLPQNSGIDTMHALLQHYASVPVISGSIDTVQEVAS